MNGAQRRQRAGFVGAAIDVAPSILASIDGAIGGGVALTVLSPFQKDVPDVPALDSPPVKTQENPNVSFENLTRGDAAFSPRQQLATSANFESIELSGNLSSPAISSASSNPASTTLSSPTSSDSPSSPPSTSTSTHTLAIKNVATFLAGANITSDTISALLLVLLHRYGPSMLTRMPGCKGRTVKRLLNLAASLVPQFATENPQFYLIDKYMNLAEEGFKYAAGWEDSALVELRGQLRNAAVQREHLLASLFTMDLHHRNDMQEFKQQRRADTKVLVQCQKAILAKTESRVRQELASQHKADLGDLKRKHEREINSLMEQLLTAKNEKTSLGNHNRALDSLLTEAVQARGDVESRLQDAMVEVQELRYSRKKIASDFWNLQESHKDHRTLQGEQLCTIRTLQDEGRALRAKMNWLKFVVKIMGIKGRGMRQELQDEKVKSISVIQSLESENAAYGVKLADQATQLACLQELRKEQEDRKKDLETHRAQLSSERSKHEEEVLRAKTDLDDANRTITALSKQNAELSSHAEALQIASDAKDRSLRVEVANSDSLRFELREKTEVSETLGITLEENKQALILEAEKTASIRNELKQERESGMAALAAKDKIIDDVRENLAANEGQNIATTQTVKDLEGQVTILRQERDILKSAEQEANSKKKVLELKIRGLKTEVEELCTAKATLERGADTSAARINELVAEIEEMKAKTSLEAEELRVDLEDVRQELAYETAHASASRQALEEERTVWKGLVEAKDKEKEILEQLVASKESDLTEATRKLDSVRDMEKVVAELRSKNHDLEAGNNVSAEESKKLTLKLVEITKEKEGVVKTLNDSCEAHKNSLAAMVAQHEDGLAKLEQSHKAEADRLAGEMNVLESQLQETTARISQRSEACRAFEKQCRESEQARTTLRGELNDAITSTQALRIRVRDLETDLDKLSSEKCDTFAKFTKAKADYDVQMAGLFATIRDTKKENEVLAAEKESLQKKYDELVVQHRHDTSVASEKEVKISHLSHANAALATQIDQEKVETASLERMNEVLNSSYGKAKAEQNELWNQKAKLESLVQDLNNAHARLLKENGQYARIKAIVEAKHFQPGHGNVLELQETIFRLTKQLEDAQGQAKQLQSNLVRTQMDAAQSRCQKFEDHRPSVNELLYSFRRLFGQIGQLQVMERVNLQYNQLDKGRNLVNFTAREAWNIGYRLDEMTECLRLVLRDLLTPLIGTSTANLLHLVIKDLSQCLKAATEDLAYCNEELRLGKQRRGVLTGPQWQSALEQLKQEKEKFLSDPFGLNKDALYLTRQKLEPIADSPTEDSEEVTTQPDLTKLPSSQELIRYLATDKPTSIGDLMASIGLRDGTIEAREVCKRLAEIADRKRERKSGLISFTLKPDARVDAKKESQDGCLGATHGKEKGAEGEHMPKEKPGVVDQQKCLQNSRWSV
ncbi:uncharacterized protein BDZ99DRAFT_497485 [Mytilinidion resinicola]|uniref:Uncharacterized protein n=1 Tax=Mytilinidion resinicola TaxID=574789 RepID=A0A6A6YSV7_9PEZI|nr:uncharacterized protein BDZ99DRAFT_497485 [Mytilinidion resinicola]KAF2811851.1 hypothetical protein BDZ99DRAFT_497485 [Mytilinidion resinicola]